MALYRIIGPNVVSEHEFQASRSTVLGAEPVLSAHRRVLESAVATADPDTGVGFKPVGKGLPLTIMIRHVYTGRYPEAGGYFSDRPGDVAVVSGVKDFDVFDASARALNLIATSQKAGSSLVGTDAFSKGTSVVAYSPAVLVDEMKLTVEIAIASFPAEFVQSVANGLKQLAGIPMFLPYAGWLLAAGEVVRLGGQWGASLTDGSVFKVTESLAFELPGANQIQSGFRLLANRGLPADRFVYQDGIGLIDAKTKRPYQGEEPYVVVSLDGRENARLANFASTAASAAVLERFFAARDGAKITIDTFIEGMRLASDLKYRKQADDIKKDLSRLKEGTDEFKKQNDLFNAVVKNIVNNDLRPAG